MPVAERLAARNTCYLMDRRGFGRSGNASKYSLDTECEDITAVLRFAGQDASVLGHSYGGICALETANRFRVRKVVLYEPPFAIGRPRPLGEPFDNYRKAVEQGRLEDALVIGLRDMTHMSEQQLADLRSTPVWKAIVPLAPTWIRELEEMQKLTVGVSRFSKMSSPTLLLVGTETAPHHIEASNALQKTLPNARTVRFAGQAHDAHLFATEQLAKAISDFMAKD